MVKNFSERIRIGSDMMSRNNEGTRSYRVYDGSRTYGNSEYGYKNQPGTGKGRNRNVEYPPYDFYYYGSEAPAYDPDWDDRRRQNEDEQRRRAAQEKRAVPRTKKKERLNPLAVLSMAGVIILMCVFLLRYISLQFEVTNAVEEISEMETELSDLKSDNDEAMNAVESSINLDDIKYRAIAELGMTYADEDQIIVYSNEEDDYVRQVIEP